MSSTVVSYIAVGANLGNREATMVRAAAQLGVSPGVEFHQISEFMENPAVGGPPDAPPFLNAVIEIETTLSPEALLDCLLEIEQRFGRVRREKWEPRTIDLDVILYRQEIIQTERLTIPHPRMHERRFVLEPLVEIAPGAIHPVLHLTATQLLERLNRETDAARSRLPV